MRLEKLKSAFALCLSSVLISPCSYGAGSDLFEVTSARELGMIDARSSEAEIRDQIGDSNMRRIIHNAGEGEYYCATEIFPDSPHSAVILWKGSHGSSADQDIEKCRALPPFQAMQNIEFVGGEWRVIGIGRGMSLLNLERANGGPVTFHSCECCADGGVADWNGGKFSGSSLSDADGSSLLGITLEYPEVDHEIKSRRDEIGNVKSNDLSEAVKKKVSISSLTLRIPAED